MLGSQQEGLISDHPGASPKDVAEVDLRHVHLFAVAVVLLIRICSRTRLIQEGLQVGIV